MRGAAPWVASLLVTAAIWSCEAQRGRPTPDAAPPPSSASTPAPGSGAEAPSDQDEAPDDDSLTGEGTGAGALTVQPEVPVDLGEPLQVEQLPSGWPELISFPRGAELIQAAAPAEGLVHAEALHAAPAADVLDWFTGQLADRGYLALERERLGPSARVRLARGRERWVVAVLRLDRAPRLSSEGSAEGTGTLSTSDSPVTLITVQQMPSERPVELQVDGGADDRCAVELPPTTPAPAESCALLAGPRLEGVPGDASEPDAALSRRDVALVYVDGTALNLVTVRGEEVRRGPHTVTHVASRDDSGIYPQVVAGEAGPDAARPGSTLWLVTWLDGDPPERVVVPYDAALSRADRVLRLSTDLGRRGDATFAPIVHRRRYPELATAWAESLDGVLGIRVAGLKRDADRVRRSGRFPISGELAVGPVLASDGDRRLAMIWGADDGIWLRSIGTDGLPDDEEHQVEPGTPTWLGTVFHADSYWVIWRRGEGETARGFWARTDAAGCLDDARGSLRGEPLQAWAHPELGPLVQVRRGERTVLLRLVDDGSAGVSGIEAELLGTSRLPIAWSDFDWREGSWEEVLAGIVRLPSGFHAARWACE